MYTSVKTLLFLKLTFIPRRTIFSLLDLQVNVMQGPNSLRLFKKFQKTMKFFLSMRPYKEISSTYLNQTRGSNCCISRKLVSNLSVKRHIYGGANFILIVVAEACCSIFMLNSKKVLFNTIFCRNKFFVLLICGFSKGS